MLCCQKQTKGYLIISNVLFLLVGCGMLIYGMMGTQLKFDDAVLLPINILRMINILGIILIFTSLIGILGAFYRERKAIHILYTTLVIIAFIYQLSIGVIVYEQTAHSSRWLNEIWIESTKAYRIFAQSKFKCCGFTHVLDHSVATDNCQPDHIVNSPQPCYEPMTYYIKVQLTRIYIAIFTLLSVEILALCNVITHMCTINSKRWEVSPGERKYNEQYNASDDTLVHSIQSKTRK
ncbi:Tetraspanin/Peripherin [Pilobolus umbonatus]|nr:Tetraspanin/Peripherin [Pilobolus umbonatus]